jgi:asparagine synthase (glutamine-hydrolysing)
MGAVQKRLMADPEVVVGVFLSGGIDSSIVAAMAHRFNKNIIAFTVGVTGSSDLVYAKMVADHLKIKHVIIPFNYEDIIEEAKKSVWHTETYLALTVLETAMMMLVSKVARQHNVKILLSGAGADELLAGYHGAFDDRTRKEKLAASVMFTYNLHVTEARMLDAATMAYTVEGREPFLDPMLIDYCLRLPASALSGPIPEEYGGGKTNKYILRQAGAIDNLLPPQVVWRKKVALYDGGGMNNYVGHFKQLVSPTEFEELKEAYPNVGLKTRADAFMFKIFRERFGEDMCRQNRVSPLFGQYPGGTFEEDGGVGENMDSNGKLKVNQLVAESRVNDIPEQLHKFVSSLVPQFKIA